MLTRLRRDVSKLISEHREKLPYLAAIALCLLVYLISKGREQVTRVYQSEGKVEFKDARVLGSQGEMLYQNKERLLSKTVKDLTDAQIAFRDSTAKLEARIAELEKGKSLQAAETTGKPAESGAQAIPSTGDESVRFHPPT